MNDDPHDSTSHLIPFVGSGLIARWPQMIPGLLRRRWNACRHSFTFDWILDECDALPIEVVLRSSGAVFEVLSGALEVGDGLERLWCQAGSAVAVSLDRFTVTPVSNGFGCTTVRVHMIGTLPFRQHILSNPAYATFLKRLAGSLRGIFDLTGPGLYEPKPRLDPGEAMVVRYAQMPAFLKFLASVPDLLVRPSRSCRSIADRNHSETQP